MIHQFHLLRPEWLLALLPLLILLVLLWRQQRFSRSWQSVVDPQLLPHLLIGSPGKTRRWPLIVFGLTGILAIVALAGPVWQKLPQPVFKQQSAMVIALDLSRSMDAADIKPSRLTRARYKISDLLKLRQEGQTALIVYTTEAFTVSPLTDDTETIDLLVPSLTTDMMPVQGSRTAAALSKARELLANAGINQGDILLITDAIDSASETAFEETVKAGHRISVLAVGTADGAPIALSTGGFLKDDQGSIVIPKLDLNTLSSAARTGQGRFSQLSANDQDVKYLSGLNAINRLNAETTATEMKADAWREEGPWLLLLLAPLAALAFRKGYLAILVVFILPLPQPAEAVSWESLWRNDNQRASEQLQQGQAQQAAELFTDPEWKAAAHYKAGDYEQALQQLDAIDHAEAHYNRGNALAKLGRIPEALEAYKQALEQDPQHADAQYNKQLLEQQQQNQQQQQQDQKQDSKDSQESGQNNSASDSSNESQSNQSDAQQQNNQQNSSNDSQQASSEQQGQQPQQAEDTQQPQSTEAEAKDQTMDEEAAQQQALPQSSQDLSEQAKQQWLRRIPDDPGGLLRNKFHYQYKQKPYKTDDSQEW